MAKAVSFTKRSLISKANSTIVTATSVAAFLVVFALVSCKTLVGQMAYQNRVLDAKHAALKQLQSDLTARDSLVASYKTFVGTPNNMIGGNSGGSGPQDGDNGKLILDALPSQYDYPALMTTLAKLLGNNNLQIMSISGTDQELTQQSSGSGTPTPVAMPFQFEVSGSYQSIQNMLTVFESSIRPFHMLSVQLAGNESNMTATVSAETFYQPGITLNIGSEAVK